MSRDKQIAGLPTDVSRLRHLTLLLVGTCFASLLSTGLALGNGSGVEFRVTEKGSTRSLPCRIHVKDQAGKPQRATSLPFWHDHFVCLGTAQLQLSPGDFTYEVERGPEYRSSSGKFKVADNGPLKVSMQLERIADLAQEGWWSGELHVHRPVADMEYLMRAEDLHIAPVITWWNNRNEWAGRKQIPEQSLIRFDQNRYYHVMAGEDEREGGALLFFQLRRPLNIVGSSREYPSPMGFVTQARRQPNVWIDVDKPFWWDVPVWLASGQVDSIGLANNHMCRSQMYESEAWGKPRDINRLPPPLGNGFWTQEIYYHILNCGLRLPPSAGSASGVLPNPVGYNRVYVHLDGNLTYEKWWDGLRAGRCVVTNGPLLRVRVNGELPGHVFTGRKGQPLTLKPSVTLTSRDPIRSVEVIKNGRVERVIPYEEWHTSGTLGSVVFKEGGWFLIRVIADNNKTFCFASTAPFYVEIGEVKRRVSKASAKFFLDWVAERAGRVRLSDPDQQRSVLRYHDHANKFWQAILNRANAE
jgi:hypothetical protein